MPLFDALQDWCRDLERRLDPSALMAHFLSLELGREATPDPFQVEAITSTASTVALRIARQSGKSCVLAARGVMELQRGGTTICLAPAERQTREITRKVGLYLRGTDMVIERATQTEIEVNTGGRFIAVPASGATIRGYTATLLQVDEAAFLPGDNGGEDVITAILPMLTDDGQVFYASTPAGKKNFFAGLFLNAKPDDGIHRIVVRGTDIPRMTAKVERLRQQLSPTKFRQEVLVEMLSDGVSYFDLDMIEKANSEEAAVWPKL